MKLRIEKPNEQVMRFFTPELYIRFNSPDDAVANQADEDWETALKKYSDHLDKLRPWMPHEVKRLANLYLHDAEVLDFRIDGQTRSPFQCHQAEFSLKQNGESIDLEYFLSGEVHVFDFGSERPFSKEFPLWLYEEIDVDSKADGMFLHRILLSDGRVIVIPFTWVRIRRRKLTNVEESQIAHQSA